MKIALVSKKLNGWLYFFINNNKYIEMLLYISLTLILLSLIFVANYINKLNSQLNWILIYSSSIIGVSVIFTLLSFLKFKSISSDYINIEEAEGRKELYFKNRIIERNTPIALVVNEFNYELLIIYKELKSSRKKKEILLYLDNLDEIEKILKIFLKCFNDPKVLRCKNYFGIINELSKLEL